MNGSVWQAALLMPYGTLDLRALTGQEDMLNGITNQLVTPKPFDTLEYVKSHDIDFAELNARVKDSILEYTLHEGNLEFYPELVKKAAEVVQTALYVKQPQFLICPKKTPSLHSIKKRMNRRASSSERKMKKR